MNTVRVTTFADLLRRHRRAAGMTQEELAEAAGLSPRGVSDVERSARTSPRPRTVRLLADALHLADSERAAFVAAAHRTLDPPEPEPITALATHPNNLPIPPTPLVGRERDVAEVAALLRREDVRLVTLTGAGGTGKTRLGLQVAAELSDAFADGIWFVRLSQLVAAALVIPTVAQTLGLREAGVRPLGETLRDYLREKQTLLVLDNFEHVVAAATEVAALLETCARLTVLVTSRVRLRLRGEMEVRVKPLPLPDPAHLPPPDQLSTFAAVALFVQRAQDAQPRFAVMNATAPAIAAICALLDGLPLAIELAAAKVRVLPPPALLARLERQLPVLAGGARDLEARQQTMRNTLAWSHDLLQPEERRLFRRLAVFVGGCTLEAAEAVCVAPEGAEPLGLNVLEGLERLVDQSLSDQREDEGGAPRFVMLHVIREFALEQLESSGEGEALHRAHAACVLALVEQAEPELTGPEQRRWLDRLEREHDNVRATLDWACEHGAAELGLRLVSAIYRFWAARGHMREGQMWVARLLALDTGSADAPLAREGGAGRTAAAGVGSGIGTRARALFTGGRLAYLQGDVATATDWLEQAAALGRAAGDLYTTAYARVNLGFISADQGDLQRAATYCAEYLALVRQLGHWRGIAVGLINLGAVYFHLGDLERAAAHFTESLALMRDVGDGAGIAESLGLLGDVARRRGDFARAETLAREALAVSRERGDPYRSSEHLEKLAKVFGASGRGERAARLLGAAEATREELGTPRFPLETVEVEEALAAVRMAVGDEAWQATYAAGRALSLEQAIAEALDEPLWRYP